jgi:hypothetical protein
MQLNVLLLVSTSDAVVCCCCLLLLLPSLLFIPLGAAPAELIQLHNQAGISNSC